MKNIDISQNNRRNEKLTIAAKSVSLLIAFLLLLPALNLSAQAVRHPLSEVSTSEKHYTYNYIMSPTQMKVIRYIIVKAENGEVKTSFDACDICYPANKGYSQVGAELKCNNCGNKFKIGDLGSQGKGGCWPGFLPHSIDGNDVVINVSDLQEGEYYFPAQVISAVNDASESSEIKLNYSDGNLMVDFVNPGFETVKIYSIDGKLLQMGSIEGISMQIDVNSYQSGVYFLTAEGAGVKYSRQFLINK